MCARALLVPTVPVFCGSWLNFQKEKVLVWMAFHCNFLCTDFVPDSHDCLISTGCNCAYGNSRFCTGCALQAGPVHVQ